ncbi:hypothetical protein VX037_11605 [Gordonia sp. Z-3]|uniref:hypothetical protein n=1 Tax=Gordonia sp. Z-3 TaxID=3115408 RepID=UPI002E2A4B11|nr:hypothetical protein [Gordonia sp. Z-3]MED5801673.1 hypothetical protein [Gordonia sp. Z-3]
MASEKQAGFIANRTRELFALTQAVEGRDGERPDYDQLVAEARELPSTEASAQIDELYRQIVAVRRAHEITKWIGADGKKLSKPRLWPDDPHH